MMHSYAFRKLPRRLVRHCGPALASLLALMGLVPTAAGQSFGPKTDYSVASLPYDLAVGDVNGDGRLDVVTANYSGNSASVLLGLAGGGFGARVDYTTGAGPLGVVLGDLNGDGRLDIVTANLNAYSGNTVSVLLGLVGGGFAPKVDYTTGLAPRGIAIGDVNGDGRLDIVTANNGFSFGGNTVSVLLGQGTGLFNPKVDYATGSGPSSVALSDLDGDGRLDIVTANTNNSTVSVLLGQAGGGFNFRVDYASGTAPYDVVLGDLNGDGRPDLVTANYGGSSGNTVSVLLGQGGGLFGTKVDYVTGTGPLSSALGDVNGDGRLDLAVANNNTNNGTTVSVLLGQAGGSFGPKTDYTTGNGPLAVALSDLNSDGRLDLLTSNAAGTVSVLLNGVVAPVLTSLNPTSGPVGTSVTITGTNLAGATGVTFNGTAATTFAVVNAGTVTATVPAGATSGNVVVTTLSGVSNGLLFTVTTATPVVTAPANNSLLNTATPGYTGTAAAGSTVTIYVDGAAVGTATANGTGNFSFTQPTALSQGSHTVYATAQSSGLGVSANSNTNTFTIDSVSPTVTITSTAGASGSTTSTTPIPFTVTFSETVTGFVQGDLTVTNGAVSGFSGSGTTYTFNVTPTTPGTATTVNVPANVAQDAANNGNTAAPSPYSITYAVPVTSTTWTGSVSTDWFDAGNWTAGVPTAAIDAIIPGGLTTYPLLTAGTAFTRALNINFGALLAQTGGVLDVRGDLTDAGRFGPGGGTVSMGLTARSNILGNNAIRFWNLDIQATGVVLNTPVGAQVRQLLTLSGNLTTNGNPLTLESNATATGMVNNNGGSIIGNVTVQRYIAPDLNPGLGYRHYSSPVSTATVGSLAIPGSFTPVVNPNYNTSATPNAETPFPTVYFYDQARLATATNNLFSFDKGWTSPSALSDPLTVGKGYTVNLAANQTLSVTGPQNNGTVALALSRNSGATAADAGWQLVGNPYPSPLDYALVAPADRPNLDAALYVFESTSQYSGTYRANVNGVGGNANSPNAVLAQGQGFFVRVSNGQTSGTLTLRNAQRVTAYQNPVYHRTAETRPLVQLDLQGGGKSDPVYVYFENGATAGVDREFDAVKLPNSTGLNVSAETGTERLAINGLPTLGTATVTVPLTVGVPAAGSYAFNAAQLLNLGTTPVYLRDKQTGAVVDLRTQPSYSFVVSNASALIAGRFELVFSPQSALATAPAALTAQVGVYPNPATTTAFVELPAALGRVAVAAELVDALGRTVRTQSLPAQGAAAHRLDLADLATGLYTLHLNTSAGVVVKKLVVQ